MLFLFPSISHLRACYKSEFYNFDKYDRQKIKHAGSSTFFYSRIFQPLALVAGFCFKLLLVYFAICACCGVDWSDVKVIRICFSFHHYAW